MLALNQYRSVLSRFYQLAAINILANMMVPLAGLCDTAFLGQLEDLKYFAGVILGSILFDYLYRTLKFLRSSTTALTAQAAGKNDGEGVLLAGLRSGLIALIISLLILGFQYPIQKFGFAVLSGTENIELSGIDYFNARIYGTPAVLLNFVLIGWFLGKVKSGRIMVLVISLVANGSNVLLDYLMISRWGWASWGAGFATSISQYLALFVGLIGVAATIDRQDLFKALPKVFRGQMFKGALQLNGDVFVRFLALISAYSIFTNFSAGISTDSLTQNGLLIQIALLSQFTIQGVGLATQALMGNFKGEGDDRKFKPLMILAIVTSLPLALLFALSTQFFPETIFGWFGDHDQLKGITRYTIWLLPLLSFTALTFMFEAYFLGLKQGVMLRNSSIISFFAVFLPLAIIAKHFQNVHLLWLSLTLYMLSNALYLGLKMVEQQHRFDSDRVKSSSSPNTDSDSDRFTPRPLPALPPHMLISYLKEQSLIKAADAKYSQPKNRRNSLPIILALAIALSAVLSSGITYYLAQSNFEQQELAQSEKAIEVRAVIAARNLEGFIGKHYLQIQEMAASPFLSDRLLWSAWSIERKQEYFQDNFLANSDGMDDYAVIDAKSGDTLFSGGTETQTINNQDIDYFQQVVMFKRPVIIPYRKSTKTGLAYMYIAAPSFDEQGNLLYVTRTRISLAEMEKQIAADINELDSIVGDMPQSPQFFLLDGRGKIIATEDSQNLEKNIDNLYSSSRMLRRNGTSAVNVETINDSAYFVAYSPIVETRGLPELNWSVILATKVD